MTNSNGRKVCGSTETLSGEPCQRPAGWGTDHNGEGRCDDHPGRGAPENNQNAVGNDGGAPENNQNAADTHVGSDPVKLFEYMKKKDPSAAEWVVSKLMGYAENAGFAVFEIDVREQGYDADDFDEVQAALTSEGDDLLYSCVKDYIRWKGTKRQFKEGLTVLREQETDFGIIEVEEGHPVNLELDRLDRSTLKQRKTLGVYNDPESQKADAAQNIAKLWADDLKDND